MEVDESIKNRIKLLLEQQVCCEGITLDSMFIEELGMDSLDFVELKIMLSDELQIEIADDVRFNSLRELFKCIELYC